MKSYKVINGLLMLQLFAIPSLTLTDELKEHYIEVLEYAKEAIKEREKWACMAK